MDASLSPTSHIPHPMCWKSLLALLQIVQNPTTTVPLHSHGCHPGSATSISSCFSQSIPAPGSFSTTQLNAAAGASQPRLKVLLSALSQEQGSGPHCGLSDGSDRHPPAHPLPVWPNDSGMLLPQGLCTGCSFSMECFSPQRPAWLTPVWPQVFQSNIRQCCVEDRSTDWNHTAWAQVPLLPLASRLMLQMLFLFFSFFFLWPHLQHTEGPRLGVESELLLPAYTTATAMLDLSRICNLRRILGP